VPDAKFCHNGRFIAAAKSYEGALAMAKQALQAVDDGLTPLLEVRDSRTSVPL
jgi:predicted RNase H-like HicB family nuclease